MIRKYRVVGHYTERPGADYPPLPQEPVNAYTAEDAVTQVKVRYHEARIHDVMPWEEEPSEPS